MLTIGSLFSGIGGLELGLEWAGLGPVKWQVEIDDYANKVLKKHWPGVERHRDIRECGAHNIEPVDLICGGFPCQDISNAGTGEGLNGERSGLWAEYNRIVREIRPRYIVIENSAAMLIRGGAKVLSDLAAGGYDAFWRVISAYELGAPHERERLFLVAYANEEYGEKGMGNFAERAAAVLKKYSAQRVPLWLQAPDRFIGVDDGVSGGLYRCRGECVGNAVAPQVAQVIGEMIMGFELQRAG